MSRPGKPPAIIVTPHAMPHVRRRARWVQRDLDDRLRRLEGAKRFGLIRVALLAMVVALAVAPAAWVWSAREEGPAASPIMTAIAARETRLVHRAVPLEEVAPSLQRAVIAAVDPAFCASGDAMRRRAAEQAFLWREAGGSWLRDGAAGVYGFWIGALWTRERTLEVVLNTADWGDGLVGVHAAAVGRFGVTPDAVDAVHHAMPLAAALLDPESFHGGGQGGGPAVRQAASDIARQVQALEQAGGFRCLAEAAGFDAAAGVGAIEG